MPIDADKVPVTLEEAIAMLTAGFSDEQRVRFRTDKDAAAKAHMGLGMGLRNEWGLWHDSPLARWFVAHGIWHADDMSGIILETFQRELRGEPWDLEGQVKHYQDFWVKSKIAAKVRALQAVRQQILPKHNWEREFLVELAGEGLLEARIDDPVPYVLTPSGIQYVQEHSLPAG